MPVTSHITPLPDGVLSEVKLVTHFTTPCSLTHPYRPIIERFVLKIVSTFEIHLGHFPIPTMGQYGIVDCNMNLFLEEKNY